MKIITIEGSSKGQKFTVVYETKNCHAAVTFQPVESGVIDLRGGRNKRCQTIAEAVAVGKMLSVGADTAHLDIH